MNGKDPYEILGVKKTASQDDIKNAYRKLAKKHHPDLNPGNKAAEAKFKDLATAYDRIGTPEQRARYDRGEFNQPPPKGPGAYEGDYGHGSQGSRGHGHGGPFYYETQNDPGARYSHSFGGGGEAGYEDLFESLFGGRGAAGRRGGASPPSGDETYQMEVDLKDAITGAERHITLPSGKTLSVKIPAGIMDGNKLRFAGQAARGDVYVEVRIKPSDHFRQRDADLFLDLPISIYEAVLGGEIRVPTVEGFVMMKIPPGVNTGSRLRLPGKGAYRKDPATGKKIRGDQILSLQVVLPTVIDPELRDAIQKSAARGGYDPRSSSESEAA